MLVNKKGMVCLGEINEKLSNPFLRGGVEEGANAGVCFTGVYFILQNTPLRPSREGNSTIPRFYLWYTITYFITPKPFTPFNSYTTVH
jgi:hypothetical protein